MEARRPRLPVSVILLGLTSFFTDVGGEMIFPLLPVFLTATLHAGPEFLGLLEGAADTVASLLKLASGAVADRVPRKKPLVLVGYGLASAVRPLVAVAQAPWHVLVVRLTDRVGKGIRSSPRDALIAGVAPEGGAGRAFGFHRAMDHAGAVVGPLLGTALLALGLQMRSVFWCAVVPGALATFMLIFVREPPREVRPRERAATRGKRKLPRRLVLYLAILCLFSLANSSDAFLLLRAHDLGIGDAAIPILWTVLHVSKFTSSWLGGDLSDRVPRARLILAGWVIFAAVYLGLAAASHAWQAWVLFIVYGTYYGLTEPAEKALVKDLAPEDARGLAFGAYNFVIGITALPAGFITGALWKRFGAFAALGVGAAGAGVAAALLLSWLAAHPRARQS